MRKAIIFDLDGTILDTETPEFVAWQEAYAALGVSLDQSVWAQAIGTADSGWDPYTHLETLIGAPADRAAIRAAGLFCVAVPNPLTAALDLTRADVVLTSLDDRPLKDFVGDNRPAPAVRRGLSSLGGQLGGQ